MSSINNLKIKLKKCYEQSDYTQSLSIAQSIVDLHGKNNKSYEYFMDLYNLAIIQQKLYKYLLAIKGFKKIIKGIGDGFYSNYKVSKESKESKESYSQDIGDDDINIRIDQRFKINIENIENIENIDLDYTKLTLDNSVEAKKSEIDLLKLVINSYNSLGICYSKNSTKIDISMAYFRKALYLSEVILPKKGYNHQELTCMILHNMACLNYDLDYFNQAIELHEKAKKLKTKQDIDYIDILNYLSYSYEALGEIKPAIENASEALVIIKKLEGINSSEYIANLYSICKLYQKNMQYYLAIRGYEQVYGLLYKKLLSEEVDIVEGYILEVLNRLSDCNIYLNGYEDAIEIQQKSLDLIKRTVGKTHIYYASNLKKTADIYYILKDYSKALLLYKEENLIKKELFGLYNKEYVKSILNLINLYILNDDTENTDLLIDYLLGSINFD